MKGMTRTLALMATVALLLVAAPNLYAQMRGGGGGQRGSQGMGPGNGQQGQMGGRQGGGIGGQQGQMGGPQGGTGRGPMGGGMGSGPGMGREMETPMGRMERANRMRSENAECANRELNDHPQMATRLNTTANDLRAGYQAALASNPSLKFGQYVAATRLEANLGATNPNITRDAILAGLADGKSIGQTLRDFGLNKHEAQQAKKRAEREFKEAKRS